MIPFSICSQVTNSALASREEGFGHSDHPPFAHSCPTVGYHVSTPWGGANSAV